MPINGWMDKKDVVHLYYGTLLSHKKNETMPFVTTWTDIEIIIVSEASQTEKNKYHTISLIPKSKKKWYKWTYLHNRNRLTNLENKLVVTRKKGWGWRDRSDVWDWPVHATIFKIDNQQGHTV